MEVLDYVLGLDQVVHGLAMFIELYCSSLTTFLSDILLFDFLYVEVLDCVFGLDQVVHGL